MAIFKCKMCGGTLEINNNETVAVCEYCGTKQTLPKLDDDRKSNLYDRANHFRRNNEFDKAMGIYEQILNEDNADAEAYWSLVLCKYGIEYVEDPDTHKRVPTVNRAQFTSVFADEDYKSALKYADGYQRSVYEEEAKAIDEIQKGILAISQKEEPFDVFICYKETDNNGRRTPDSVLANDLYHQLTQEGFKVFFSRITLEDKLGTAYEPYIFAALNSSKVMVVLGTKPEYFNAVWVKNEWSRYLAFIKNGAKKMLIPAYKDMDPYDLPEEFSHLQAQDMSKLGFMQDLIRGIKKIVQTDEPKVTAKETVVISGGNANTEPLLKRAFIFLEDRDWRAADEYCEKVLDIDPENAQAYLGKLMAELQVNTQEGLENKEKPFDDRNNYQKAVRFGDDKLRETLKGYIAHINKRNENSRLERIYTSAISAMNSAATQEAFKKAAKDFKSISYYKDSKSLAEQCFEKADIIRKNEIYDAAKASIDLNIISELEHAIIQLESISGWKDADEQICIIHNKIEEIKADKEIEELERKRKAEIERLRAEKRSKIIKKVSIIIITIIVVSIASALIITKVIIPSKKYNQAIKKYNQAINFENNGDYSNAIPIFTELEDFKDSADHINLCIYNQALICEKNKDYSSAIDLFIQIKDYNDAQEKISGIWDRIAVRNTLGVGAGNIVGLKPNGTVVAVGSNSYGQCNVSDWRDIIAISVSGYNTVGLKSNGTVVVAGMNGTQCNVSDWKDIVSISSNGVYTIGLKYDGTVVAVGNNDYGQCDISEWKDIVAISAGNTHTIGLKFDGTVVAVGNNDYGQCDISEWKDIVAISTGLNQTVGLKSDGTVVTVGRNDYGQRDISEWKDIVAISAGSIRTVGLKSDGTVVAVGYNASQVNAAEWKDIVAIEAELEYTVGLKSDGTVVVVGDGQCDVSSWKNIKTPVK